MKIFLILILSVLFSFNTTHAMDSEIIYVLSMESSQYIVYDKASGVIIVNYAYEPVYNYETKEYFLIAPIDLNTNIIDDNTPFSGVSFNEDDVIIVNADTGEKLVAGRTE